MSEKKEKAQRRNFNKFSVSCAYSQLLSVLHVQDRKELMHPDEIEVVKECVKEINNLLCEWDDMYKGDDQIGS